jgi:uncharacterized protein with NRDE domain
VCTVVLSFEPGNRVPLLLLGVRDELTDRPWLPPGRHWAGSPLFGGLDEQAGGTWLAVHPDVPRVACLLNGRGTQADQARRRSRGELPLRAGIDGAGVLKELADDPRALAAYDPFHLICADTGAVRLLSWDGGRPAARDLEPGDGLNPGDPAAIVARRDLPGGQVWGSTSLSLVALAADGGLRYDFQPHPGATTGWYPVDFTA